MTTRVLAVSTLCQVCARHLAQCHPQCTTRKLRLGKAKSLALPSDLSSELHSLNHSTVPQVALAQLLPTPSLKQALGQPGFMGPSLMDRLELSDTRDQVRPALFLPPWMHRKGWETGVGMDRGLTAHSAKPPLFSAWSEGLESGD